MGKTRKETKVVAIVKDVREKKAEIPKDKGFFTPVYEGNVEYEGNRGNLMMKPIDTSTAKAQTFKFTYTEECNEVRGWCGINGYTGAAHVELETSTNSFRNLKKLERLMKRAKMMVFDSVATMGWQNYENTMRKTNAKNNKTKTKQELGKADDIIPFAPAEVEIANKRAASTWQSPHRKTGKKKAAAIHRESYVRAGGWVTGNPNHHYNVPTIIIDGVLKYKRKGGMVKRHI